MAADKKHMKKWAREHMRGVENETIPSFTPDMKALDEEGIRWDVQQAIRHGFFSTLCTCEAGLTFEEAKRFVSIVTNEARDKLLVNTTILFDSIEQNFEMLQHAEKAGCHAALLGFPPNFHPQTEEEIYNLARDMCQSTNLAIILYPSPQYNFERFHFSGFPLGVLDKLADLDNVVAIKVGEPGLIAECVRLLGDRLLVSCPVERWLPLCIQAFKQQWIGAGPYEAFQSPEKPYVVEYFNLLMQGKWDEGMEIYWKLTPVRVMFEQAHMSTVMLGTYNWTMHKYYQWLVGGNGGYTRQPCMKILQHDMEAFKMALRMIGIEPREPDDEFYVGRVNYAKMKGQSPQSAVAQIDLKSVKLMDANDNKIDLTTFRGSSLVLCAGGRGAAAEMQKWLNSLEKNLAGIKNARLFRVALLAGMPAFIPKKQVKESIAKESAIPTLFIWDKESTALLGYNDPSMPFITVISADGEVVLSTASNYSDSSLDKVLQTLK